MFDPTQPFALLADLRANAIAVQAVLADLDAKGIRQFAVFGDMVGFGPDPFAVAEMIYRWRSDLVAIIGHPSSQILADALPPQINAAANRTRPDFMALTRINLKTARAWAIKETAGGLWAFSYRGAAEREWERLLSWISRCRLKPVVKVGNMVREHLWGIQNAIIAKVTNAKSESMNSRIQKIKAMACGFRNRTRFRRAILFHLGGLKLLPEGAFHPHIAHTET